MEMTKDLFEMDADEIFVNSFANGNAAEEAAPQETTPRAEDVSASQRALLRALQDPAAEKLECFGGVLLQRTDVDGYPIFSFVVQDMTERELAKAKKEYAELFRSGLQGIICGASPFIEQAENYTAFNFVRDSHIISLRSYCQTSNKAIPAETMMRKLVSLLIDRYNRYNSYGITYQSLNCFTLDTIFTDNRLRLWILPLRAFRNCFPLEIAPEAHDPTQPCDETSDLYAAAHVSLEVSCGGKPDPMLYHKNSTIRDCVSGIPQARPSLKQVAAVLSQNTDSATAAPKPAGTGTRTTPPNQAPDTKPAGNGFVNWFKALWKRFLDRCRQLGSGESKNQITGTLVRNTKRGFRPIQTIGETDEDQV